MLNPIIPYAKFTQFTPALPEFYWDVYSAEQRIKHICYELCKMHAYADYLAEQIDVLGEDVEGELLQMQRNLDKQQRSFQDEIIRLIGELQEGFLQWDVQLGRFVGTVEAQRDMFNDVTVHAYNCEQLETVFDEIGMDVNGLARSGLNVKGFAVYNQILEEPDGVTSDMVPTNPSSEGTLTVSDLSSACLDEDGYVFVSQN